MTRKKKYADKKNRTGYKKKPSKKETVQQPQLPEGPQFEKWYYHPFIKPLTLIVQILWVFLDVATLLLRMVVLTILYDTPHGKHEMMLDAGSNRESK